MQSTSPNPTMLPTEFIRKWRNTTFGERQASQAWFLDLLRVIGHPDPIEYNAPERFTFEKAVPGGFADAYLDGCFAWEFKRNSTQLERAFDQLLRYQIYLRTPPLLIASAFSVIKIQTNFPGKETVVHEIPIIELIDPDQFAKLQSVFFNPGEFEPGRTIEEVTRDTIVLFGKIAGDMEERGSGGEHLARYLNQIVFCLYAEDAGLLKGNPLSEIARNQSRNPGRFNLAVRNLFEQMANGGMFGANDIAHFDGDLFTDSDIVELSETSLQRLVEAAAKNWRDIEPSIFGTLFEGVMDATKRSQMGAHYTGADDIMLVIEPVIMKPLRREWEQAKQAIDNFVAGGNADEARAALDAFRNRLASVKVLDPACGSGNFLYIAMRALLDLEKQAIDYGAEQGWYGLIPRVNPSQMAGIEIDHYAAEIARTALWIGYIQWHLTNGFAYTRDPVLSPINAITRMDAILDFDDDGNTIEPQWPDTDFIVGNPPFLGRGYMRSELGDEYTNRLHATYEGRLPNASDLCCYWFEKSREMIEVGRVKRVGLLATQGIRGRDNRAVLRRIKESGDIFLAHSDRNWTLDGASVHISIIGFDDGSEKERMLDDEVISGSINANLTMGPDTTAAKRLKENRGISFEGQSPKARFDIPKDLADFMLAQPLNLNGKPNSDVIFPVMNATDITDRSREMYTINFGLMGFDESLPLRTAVRIC